MPPHRHGPLISLPSVGPAIAAIVVSVFFPRDAIRRAQLWDCMSSVRPSVTFRYRDHIGWNTSKVISRPNTLRLMRSLKPTWAIWCNSNTPKISVEPGAHKSCKMSETMQHSIPSYFDGLIGNLIRAFDWHQNQWPWMTLNGRFVTLAEINNICGAHHKNFNEDRLIIGCIM